MPKGVYIRKSFKGRTWTKEQKRKMSLAYLGENNPFYGKHHSEATKKIFSEMSKRKKTNLGRYFPEEWKQKLSEVQKGEKSYWFGRHHTKEAKIKIGEANRRRIFLKETRGKHSKNCKKQWRDGIMDKVFISPTTPEKAIMMILEDLKLKFTFQFRPQNYSKVYDFYIPSLNLLIEFDGIYWHKNTQERDAEKTIYAENNNYKLLRLNEKNLNLCKSIICDICKGVICLKE